MKTYQVRLNCGFIGTVTTPLKEHEQIGRVAMATTEIDGQRVKKHGIVQHVYVQEELEL